MILAIDIGNTNVVFGCAKNNEYNFQFISRLASARNRTKLEYTIDFKRIIELHNISITDINGVVISSVVPPLTNVIRDAVKALTDKKIIIVGPDTKTDLNILVDNPEHMGTDRIVDAVSAIFSYPKPLIIFDMGTATTISVIDKDNNYIGGMISPGVGISFKALTTKTAQLPSISLEFPGTLISKNTIDCMKSGIIYGNASMIDGMIERVENELNQTHTVVATGGWSSCIIPHCKRKIIFDENLLLKGLLVLYNKNK